jgi:hypothetical protein
MRRMKRFVLALLFLAGVAAAVGCAQVRDEDVPTPWARPEPWEQNVGIGPFTPE